MTWEERFDKQFVDDGIRYSLEDGSLLRDPSKKRVKGSPDDVKQFISSELERVRADLLSDLKQQVEGKREEITDRDMTASRQLMAHAQDKVVRNQVIDDILKLFKELEEG